MIVGIPKEIKNKEDRVAMTPAGVEALVRAGHTVYVEKSAGKGSFFSDKEYVAEGAIILNTAEEVWAKADMIVKVKEPLESEYKFFRKGLIIFTYLHLAAEEKLTEALIKAGTVAIAYETVQKADNSLPLLAPMSEIAGRMAVQNGVIYLEKIFGGKGKLIDGVSGVNPGHIVILGGGVVGTAACRRAVGLGARVTILDVSIERLRYLSEVFFGKIETAYSNSFNLKNAIKTADLVVGAVLVPGAKAPKLITEDMMDVMPKGGVVVDVAIDQGGCVEGVHATSHVSPTYKHKGLIIYSVANIPGAVPQTATLALTNATLMYVLKLAKLGWVEAVKSDTALAKGVNIVDGKVTYAPVANALGYKYVELSSIIK